MDRTEASSARHGHGLVIGKFYPFHAGHQALVRAATSSCDRVTVEVMAHSVESIPVDVRVGWVQAEHPTARVVAAPDDHEVDFDSPAVWDLHLEIIGSHLDGPVDAVFTSDAYGEELARRLGATWVQVDPGRASTPISGTAVRADVAGSWWALPTPVRAWFAKRIVVVGTRPAGATPLAEALGAHYGTTVVPDLRREWIEQRPGGPADPWHAAELDLVARQQAALEDAAAAAAPRPLVLCETDVLTSAPWLAHPGPRPSPTELRRAAQRRAPALYVLIADEAPGAPDLDNGAEDDPRGGRRRLREELATRDVGWVEVRGTHEERLAAAVAAVDEVVAEGWRLADPVG
ncbi:multifunctional transcriptional regulator/nicotinamide-nucleotide adenylyltransferase/ribosylnicotinamide kinase NadR [Terrabacter aerolatus]|uniref:Trifunctional nicotinamide-nucleotide adenylyltransferase/ribosylnicotinamide kinase/transcriptional regulator NadR n=1 Tax=Terrabacter aerolatus TaxID=422442 RepID=A0A512D675_9MICO|nr:AAA family ATPase [Terrabacter aerolatus]GEO31760.1 trifunctional nicotinamide-nucleotide adenylyltransferase/ribosylnicotinamide kinase/transcriptional regulator NadR [Terrabacter aerolatus]